jgi:hypothetical protein
MRRRRGRKSVTATTIIIDGSEDAIFGVLTDPAKHAAIDGTGWVREFRDGQPLTAVGRIFCSSGPRQAKPTTPDARRSCSRCSGRSKSRRTVIACGCRQPKGRLLGAHLWGNVRRRL